MTTTTNNNNRKSTIGLAIVGCGQIVTHHLSAIIMDGATSSSSSQQQQPFCIRALVDPNPDRRQVILRNYYRNANEGSMMCRQDDDGESILLLNSLEELANNQHMDFLENQIDVIFIAVPHDLHESLCMQALLLNKTVVLEKPLAVTKDACERLIQVSSSKDNSMLIVAEQSPYWQEVVLAKKLIRDGAVGTVITAASYYYESMRDNVTSGDVDSSTGGLGWRGSLERAGGGIMMDGGLHWIRPLREMLGGRITNVVGKTRRHLAPSLQLEGEVVAHGLFEIAAADDDDDDGCEYLQQPDNSGPLIATYSCNMLATAPMAHDTCPYFRITGTQGEIVIHGDGLFKDKPGAGGLRLYNNEYPEGKELFDPTRKGGFFNGFAGLWQEIHRIHTQKDRAAAHETVVRAADDVRVVLALYKSSESGKWEAT
jgi:UDP-N-acetyl-2-amino-2-deoxyglucuronate dehydrogenase